VTPSPTPEEAPVQQKPARPDPRATEQLRASGFPRVEEFARGLFVTPTSAEAASQMFEQWAEDRARGRA